MNYIEIFLEALIAEKGRSPRTIESYGTDLRAADAALPGGLMGADAADIQSYLSSLPDKASSVARHASALRGFYKFLMLEKIISKNPTANLELPKRARTLPKLLTADEIELLISSAGDTKNATRLRAMLELTYASGLRVSELCELPVTAILGDRLLIHGKGAKERMVPMHTGAIAALSQWMVARGDMESKYVFPSSSKSGHITRDGFFKIMKKCAVLAGIDPRCTAPSCCSCPGTCACWLRWCWARSGARCLCAGRWGKSARDTNNAGTRGYFHHPNIHACNAREID